MNDTGRLHAVNISTAEGVVTATIVGEVIEAHRATAIVEAVKPVIVEAGDLRALVIDFSEVNFVNSSGLSAIVELRNSANAAGASTIAYRPTDTLHDIFTRSKFDSLLKIAKTPQELTAALAAGA